MSMVVAGSGHFSPTGGSFSTFAIPLAMQPGDLLVFMVSNLTSPAVDPANRFAWLNNYTPSFRVASGYWVSPSDIPIDTTPISVPAVDAFPWGYAQWSYTIFRNVDGNLGDAPYSDRIFTENVLQSVAVPSAPARGAVALLYGQATGFVPAAMRASSAWDVMVPMRARVSLGIWLWESSSGDREPIEGYGFAQAGTTGGRIRGYVLPLDVPPIFPPDPPGGGSVVRQWPRDDARGVSSASRLWPSPKRNRLAGGYPGGA